jgi:hypothetical protein
MVKFNLKLSDSTYRILGALAESTDATMADVFREALSIFWWLEKEYRQGNRLMIKRGDELTELLIPSLARPSAAALPQPHERPEFLGEEEAAEGIAPPRRRRRPNTSPE